MNWEQTKAKIDTVHDDWIDGLINDQEFTKRVALLVQAYVDDL